MFCAASTLLSFSFSFTPLPFPLHVSPLSFLFFALSDMSQDSSDEESEEEEDFSRVQFGSRYTAGRTVCFLLVPVLLTRFFGRGLPLTAHSEVMLVNNQ